MALSVVTVSTYFNILCLEQACKAFICKAVGAHANTYYFYQASTVAHSGHASSTWEETKLSDSKACSFNQSVPYTGFPISLIIDVLAIKELLQL